MNEPYKPEDFADYNTFRNFVDMGVEAMFAPVKRRRSYRNPFFYGQTRSEDILSAIEAENVKASQQ